MAGGWSRLLAARRIPGRAGLVHGPVGPGRTAPTSAISASPRICSRPCSSGRPDLDRARPAAACQHGSRPARLTRACPDRRADPVRPVAARRLGRGPQRRLCRQRLAADARPPRPRRHRLVERRRLRADPRPLSCIHFLHRWWAWVVARRAGRVRAQRQAARSPRRRSPSTSRSAPRSCSASPR